MGGLKTNEVLLLIYVLIALVLWIFGAGLFNGTTVALLVISLMLITGVTKWSDMIAYKDAWNTLAWFATLVALASGLARVGFIKWFAESVGVHLGGMSPLEAIIVLALVNYLVHYMFASVTAHVTAVLPVLLAVGAAIPPTCRSTKWRSCCACSWASWGSSPLTVRDRARSTTAAASCRPPTIGVSERSSVSSTSESTWWSLCLG